MKKVNVIDLMLGREKSWRPTTILVWLGFLFGAIIILVIPENILANFSSYAITPTVENFVKCSTIKVTVAAYFNLMLIYSLVIALTMSMTLKLKYSDMQKFGRWVFPIAILLIFSIYIVLTQLEPSCVSQDPARSARRLDMMINSPINLLIMGGLFVNGIGIIFGVAIKFTIYFIGSLKMSR